MMDRMEHNRSKRGLASASAETRRRVARAGGRAHHEKRGRHGADHNNE